MSRDNEGFGSSPGPYKPIASESLKIKLLNTGLNVEVGPADIEASDAVDMSNLRIVQGGVSPEYGLRSFPVGALDPGTPGPILHVTSFEKPDDKKVVRMKHNEWQWFDGDKWLVIPGGAIDGLTLQRLYTTVLDDKLVAANAKARLLAWDGNPANAVAQLSAEAPSAHFVTRIGQRLMVANARFGTVGAFDPNLVAWSADGDILEWTDVILGAGAVSLKPEGTASVANAISGLSNLERGTVIYRERTIVLASRTGVRAAPFRFATVDFSKGTESPYSIANGGMIFGDIFLGFDFVVYHFDGQNAPVPIGMPIRDRLEERIADISECVGFIDPMRQEYHLLSPTIRDNKPILNDDHIFSIKDYVRRQKLSWRYRPLNAASITVGNYVPRVTTNFVPFVDSFSALVDRVDPTDAPVYLASAVIPTAPTPSGVGRPVGAYSVYDTTTTLNPNTGSLNLDHSPTSRNELVGRINNARIRGMKLCLPIPGSDHNPWLTNGQFDMGKWTDGLQNFNTPANVAAVQEGLTDSNQTVQAIMIVDEPFHPTWNGSLHKPILDDMARQVKAVFGANCPVWVAGGPVYDWESTTKYVDVDGVSYQWDSWRQSYSTFINLVSAQAAFDGVKFSIGINLLNGGLRQPAGSCSSGTACCPLSTTGGPGLGGVGGDGRWLCRLHADQLEEAGIAFINAGVFFLPWKWESAFFSNTANLQAYANIRAAGNALPRKNRLRTQP